MKSFAFIISLFLFFALLSCSDTEDPIPAAAIDGNLLVNANGWKVESSIKDDGKIKRDLFAQYTPCVADNVYKFQSDGRYTIDEGRKKCDTTALQIKEVGEWILKGSSLTLSPLSNVPYQFIISSLTVNQLVFTNQEIGSNGVVKSITTTTLIPLTSL